MIKLEEITSFPTFSNQLENKILFSNHTDDISVSYESTYTLKYVIDGSKQYGYNNQEVEVFKHQYLILNKDTQISTEAKKGTKGLSLFLSEKLIEEIAHFYSNHSTYLEFLEIIKNRSNQKVNYLLKKIVFLYMNDQIGLKEQLDDLFIRIAELVVQEQVSIDNNFVNLKIVKHDTKRELYKLITESKDYLTDNIKEKISLNKISQDIGISKYYLHRLFTEIYGTTPLGYLTTIRLEKARNKLLYSKETIFEIAINCGFDSASYFSNLFKKNTGFSPTQFRRFHKISKIL